MKKNFAVDDKVVLRGFGGGDKALEEATGVILGKSFDHAETDFYIVLLDRPLYAPTYVKAVCMIESCIYLSPAKGKIEDMIDLLTNEHFRAKSFINSNGFDCTSAPFVIARRYRNELKQHVAALRENIDINND